MTRAELVDLGARALHGHHANRFGESACESCTIRAGWVVAAIAEGAEERVREWGMTGTANLARGAVNAVLGVPS